MIELLSVINTLYTLSYLNIRTLDEIDILYTHNVDEKTDNHNCIVSVTGLVSIRYRTLI